MLTSGMTKTENVITINKTVAKNQNVVAVPTLVETGWKNSVTKKASVQLKAAEIK